MRLDSPVKTFWNHSLGRSALSAGPKRPAQCGSVIWKWNFFCRAHAFQV